MNTEQERAALLPCPFCGGEPKIVKRDVEPQGDSWYGKKIEQFVECGCGACLFDELFHEGFYKAEEAIAAWNRRAALQSQSMDAEHWAELHRLRAERGPVDGSYATWQEAAAGEKRKRIEAEKALQSQDREVIIEALKCAQNNECGPRRPFGSSDPDSDDYDRDAFMWDYYQRAIDHARRIEGDGE